MNRLDNQLRSAYEASKQKVKIELHLKYLEELIPKKQKEIDNLILLAVREEADIVQLEKLNILSLFYTILSSKEQQLEKERQEYLHAFLKLKGAKEDLKALEFEKEILEQKKSGLQDIEKELNKLLQRKEAELKVRNKTTGKLLFEIEKKIMRHQAKSKEIKEAIKEGEKAITLLSGIITELKQVKSWGAIDNWESGYFNMNLKKKQCIDKATKEAFKSNKQLHKFEEELRDVTTQYQLDYHLQMEALDDFLSFYIDNMITDWVVQQKIKNTFNGVGQIIDRVNRILLMLEQEIKKTAAFIEKEEEEKKRLILLEVND